MTFRCAAALVVVATTGLAACAPQPASPPAAAAAPASAPASTMPGMSAAEHQRMMQQGQAGQTMPGMTAAEHQRMMQSQPRQ